MAQGPDHLNLSTLPEASRADGWSARLADLGLTAISDGKAALTGTLSVLPLASGVRLGRLVAPPQEIGPAVTRSRPAPLLAVLTLRSRGVLSMDGQVQYFAQNDIAVLDLGNDWCLRWSGDAKAILLEVPHDAASARLGRQRPSRPLVLGRSIAADVARSMLTVLGGQFDTLTQQDLAISEGALLDVICNAISCEADFEDGLMTPVQVAHFQRVAAAIDARLMMPELSLRDVAGLAGLSPRYVQRLFQLHGDSFSRHIRQKRLARSRADLLDMSQNSVGISQIAHRWGFASASHFSRSFRDAFGISPRELREDSRHATLPYAFRGNPGKAAEPAPADRAHQPSRTTSDPAAGLPEPAAGDGTSADFILPARADTVHWGHISRTIPPVLYVPSGSVVRVETLTQHGGDDYARFVNFR